MLYVIRHGETDWNRLGRIQGRSDIPLNDQGRMDARALSTLLHRVTFDRVVSSDLMRARETAAILADDRIAREEDARLQERSFGPYEGMTVPEIRTDLHRRFGLEGEVFDPVGAWPDDSGVESLSDLTDRAWRAVMSVRDASRNGHVALVTHGNVVHVLLAWILDKAPEAPRAIRMPNCCCLELEWRGDRPMLRALASPGMLGA